MTSETPFLIFLPPYYIQCILMTTKSSDPNFDYSAFASMGHNSPPDKLTEIAALAEKQLAAQLTVDRLEVDLENAKSALKEIAERRMPELMEDAGMQEFTTTNGIHIGVKEKVRGALPVPNRPLGYDWLEKNNAGAIIKAQVIVPFERNELEDAMKLVKTVQVSGRIAELKRDVNAATLDLFIRERLAEGKDIPLNIFSVHRQRIAKVERDEK